MLLQYIYIYTHSTHPQKIHATKNQGCFERGKGAVMLTNAFINNIKKANYGLGY